MWYPAITPFRTGSLAVGDGHELYWEMCGNPRGSPALFLHGGPGGGCTPTSRRWFAPDRYCIILFDQRGCGRSTPHASLEHNTTAHVIADIEALRVALDVEQWLLFGRSWGAALALAYAEAFPGRVTAMVLSGVFTARRSELEWLYRGGAAHLFPEGWSRFVGFIAEPERGDLVAAYHARLICGDAEIEAAAARAWCGWEHAISTLLPSVAPADDGSWRARARIQTHYFLHHAFLDEGRLLAGAERLAGIPGIIVEARYDAITPPTTAWELHQAWPASSLQIVPDAGHDSGEPGTMRALIEATDTFANPGTPKPRKLGTPPATSRRLPSTI